MISPETSPCHIPPVVASSSTAGTNATLATTHSLPPCLRATAWAETGANGTQLGAAGDLSDPDGEFVVDIQFKTLGEVCET